MVDYTTPQTYLETLCSRHKRGTFLAPENGTVCARCSASGDLYEVARGLVIGR